MKKPFRIVLGLLCALGNLVLFGGLAWWVSDEGSVLGYVATGLFVLMAVGGDFVAFTWFAMEDKGYKPLAGAGGDKGEVDATTLGVTLMVGSSDPTTEVGDGDDGGADFD
ncbi:MAG: hypothetical protein GY731_20465 [Gammaproteobacteria bacterium]|nr:hypothetical protein [Gammaproteobacteria bacterium]